MEKDTTVRMEMVAEKRAVYAALDRLLAGMDGTERRALLLLLLEATK